MSAIVRSRAAAVIATVTVIAAAAAWLLLAPHAGAAASVLRVGSGGQFAKIQQAVNAAQPGDFILVEPGIYKEDVTVPEGKNNITIRGLDRNAVILDGEFTGNIAIMALADGVKMENMTARNYRGNGFYWRSVTGFEGRYLTTYRIGLYGIYAFDSVQGIFEKSYASGSGDAAFYIGNCRPCDAVIDDVVGEWSALGYSGTNSGGNLTLRNSTWRKNGTGIVPNSLDSQRDPPQRGGTLIVNNIIESNGNTQSPGQGIAGSIMGHGVGIAGGEDNVVRNNIIRNNTDYGVVVFPIPDSLVYLPNDNTVRDNTFDGNGTDLALSAGNGTGNCFSGNHTSAGADASSAPDGLQDLYPCDDDQPAKKVPIVGDPGVAQVLVEDYAMAQAGQTPRPGYETTPIPEPQPTMPNPEPVL